MLAIRLQRLGRKSLPVYRLAVQESQRHPSSGRVVAYVGSYNPHSKEANINVEKVEYYLGNGAQPTPRVVRILRDQKVTLPSWVKDASKKESSIKTPEKLRRNQPKEEAPTDEVSTDSVATEEANEA